MVNLLCTTANRSLATSSLVSTGGKHVRTIRILSATTTNVTPPHQCQPPVVVNDEVIVTTITGSTSRRTSNSAWQNLNNQQSFRTFFTSSKNTSILKRGEMIPPPSHPFISMLCYNQHNCGNSNINRSSYRGINKLQKKMFSSSSKEDFYKILGVKKGDDKGTIKKAYFKLAKKYHPDTNKVRVELNVKTKKYIFKRLLSFFFRFHYTRDKCTSKKSFTPYYKNLNLK